MKRVLSGPLALSLLSTLLLPSLAWADTTLTVVGNYAKAGDAAVWSGESAYDVPEALLQEVRIPTPSRAYTYPHPDVFLQNDRVVVCGVDCDAVQRLVPASEGLGGFTVGLQSPPSRKTREADEAILRQTTVYYWVNRVLDRFAELGHTFDHRLEIFVDREIDDPQTGETLTNNAFFLSTQVDVVDWSLSFLPSERAMGYSFLPSAYDPSVAMHEATHFVFQELVGDILNPEVYGLHEAFADYFSMALLGSPDIGEIMMSGEPLRTARDILQYQPNMEAHDLGNVVVSALWNIRVRFTDKDRADLVALHTIQNIGGNPFADAAYVTQAYYDALHMHAEDALQADPGLLGDIDRIWQATRLETPALTPNLDAIAAPMTEEERRREVTMTIQVTAPPQSVLEYGLPPVQKDTVTLINVRQGPAGSDYRWFEVAIQDLDASAPSATPFWILYSPSTHIIRYAYTLDRRLVTVSSESIDDYRRLVSLNENLGNLLDYAQGFAADLVPLAHKGKWGALKAKKAMVVNSYYNYGFSNRLVPMYVYQIPVRPTFGGLLASWFGAPGIRATEEVRLYTVKKGAVDTTRLPEVDEDEVLVGYEIRNKTGFTVSVRLDELGEDQPRE